MRSFQKLKLSAKLSATITTLLILGFGVVCLVTYTVVSNALSESIRTNLTNSARDAATLFSSKCDAMKNEVDLIAQRPEIQSMNWPTQGPALKKVVTSMGYMRALVADTQGDANFTNDTQANIADRAYFKTALSGKINISDPVLSKSDNKCVIVVASPIKDSGGKIIGVLCITRDANALTDMANQIVVGKTGYAYLLNSSGVVIAHPEADKVQNAYSFIEEAKKDPHLKQLADISQIMISGKDGNGEYSYKGVTKVTSYAPIPNTTWSIALSAPKSEFFSSLTTLLILLLSITAVIILASIFTLLAMIRSIIIRPILKLVDISEKIALGDIGVTVEVKSQDEIGALNAAFQKMISSSAAQAKVIEQLAAGNLDVEAEVHSDVDLLGKKLNELISKNNSALGSITTAADQVAIGAKQLSDSSLQLSQGAAEQASSLEQLSASIEEISENTQRNTKDALEASQLAERARSNAIEGDKQMKDMLSAMGDINESSDNISKIIKVIDDIAFQTNILALNAAVEAARAGQHGKGFAVVAEEVRTLAARSANAAKETTDLIENSIRKVGTGAKIANETASSLNKIVQDIAAAAGLVSSIATASKEQSDGIGQIRQALTLVNSVVQTNSASAEEGAASSEELATQADIMKEEMAHFKLKATQSMPTDDAAGFVHPIRLAPAGGTGGAAITSAAVSRGGYDFGKY